MERKASPAQDAFVGSDIRGTNKSNRDSNAWSRFVALADQSPK
jgi:hypothetical protein